MAATREISAHGLWKWVCLRLANHLLWLFMQYSLSWYRISMSLLIGSGEASLAKVLKSLAIALWLPSSFFMIPFSYQKSSVRFKTSNKRLYMTLDDLHLVFVKQRFFKTQFLQKIPIQQTSEI